MFYSAEQILFSAGLEMALKEPKQQESTCLVLKLNMGLMGLHYFTWFKMKVI